MERVRYYYLIITNEAIYSGYMLNEEAWNIAKSKPSCSCRRFKEESEMKNYMQQMSIK